MMDIEWKKYLVGIALSGAAGLGTTLFGVYKTVDTRIGHAEQVSDGIDRRLMIQEERGIQNGKTMERLEDKIDWLIRTENEQHRMKPAPPPQDPRDRP